MINFEKKAKVYKALSEPIRLKILEYLLNKKDCACVCELQNLVKRDISVIFRHVLLLKGAGLIDARKEGNFLMCCIRNKQKVRRYLEG